MLYSISTLDESAYLLHEIATPEEFQQDCHEAAATLFQDLGKEFIPPEDAADWLIKHRGYIRLCLDADVWAPDVFRKPPA